MGKLVIKNTFFIVLYFCMFFECIMLKFNGQCCILLTLKSKKCHFSWLVSNISIHPKCTITFKFDLTLLTNTIELELPAFPNAANIGRIITCIKRQINASFCTIRYSPIRNLCRNMGKSGKMRENYPHVLVYAYTPIV